MHPRLSSFRRALSARLKVPTPPAARIGRCLHAQIPGPAGVYPVGGGPSQGARPGYRTGPQIMAKYVFSFRVPSDYQPNAGTPAEWQAWFGGLGSALADVGHAVTDYASLGEVGGSGSRMVAYSVVSAEDMDSALGLAKGCPVLRVGGGVEVGPVMEAAGS